MTQSQGPLPNFFVVGTAKCATTSLARFFEQHPDVCFCQAHEPNFFAFDANYAKGLDFYRSRYSHYDGERAIGEKSWRYSCSATYPDALERMLAAVPMFKAIYVVRDPLPRALSMWRELRDGGQDILPADPNKALREANIVTDSMLYDSQIGRFEDVLGKDNVLIVFYEDFLDDPRGFYSQICEFLEIAGFYPEEDIHANKSVAQRSDTRLLSAIRTSGLAAPLRRLAPAPVRKLVRNLLKQPVGEIEISAETRRMFFERVGPDCAALLARTGRDPNFWTLS
ncbi:sulfotransferase family protein [Erythrobacter alti]|uniref:sulfotransferase family protein n=1 Tax=Erythrobacter alti TaxID=1896145 RepID=UPI0030F44B34